MKCDNYIVLGKHGVAAEPDNSWHERGELPPVGVECEAFNCAEWHKTKIIGMDDKYCVYVCDWDCELPYQGDSDPENFRPIKSERDLFIEAALAAIGCAGFGYDEAAADYFEALYDSRAISTKGNPRMSDHLFGGYKLIECQVYQSKTKRSLKERLFSLPWEPFKKFNESYTPFIPDGEFIIDDQNYIIYGSKNTINELIEAIKENK